MIKKIKTLLIILIIVIILALIYRFFNTHDVAVLDPKGTIAAQERNLFFLVLGLMLIVVIPVFFILFIVVHRYREGRGGKYKPDFDHSRILETAWWLIPSILISVIAVITWNATYKLNPYNQLDSSKPQLSIEVVSMDWKWLFIYPSQHVASVNQLNLPINTPVDFYITSDSVMNSFWIPQLSGQIYAMPGMNTQLHLMATSDGSFYGSSANISGAGFAGMHFQTVVTPLSKFEAWIRSASKSPMTLSMNNYALLNRPSINNPVESYKDPASNLYVSIIDKFLAPGQTTMMGGM